MTEKAAPISFEDKFVQIINGKSAPTREASHGVNPANKQSLPPVPVATEKDVDDAVLAGKAAFKTWSRTSHEDRKKRVLSYAQAIEDHHKEFERLLVQENGKTLKEAHHEVELLPLFLRGHAEISLPEDVYEDFSGGRRTVKTTYVPLGVVAAITSYTFPLFFTMGKISPALLTGNVIIVKASTFTPYSCLKLVELAQKFFPPGVIQSLSGTDDLGPWITSHAGIDHISFTGSSETGKKVMQGASKNLTRVTLSLSGNDAAIIFPDVDLEKAAARIAANVFMCTGQVCVTIKRIYVHEKIYEKFKEAMVESIRKFKVGDGSLESTTHGPLQSALQYDKMRGFLDEISQKGWKVVTGGKIQPSAGYFVEPTVIEKPADNSRIVVEEQTGPVVPLLSWKDEGDVIARVNDSLMGLGASLWTTNLDKAAQLATDIQAGNIWVNEHTVLRSMVTYGGHKQSGLGSEWGVEGLKSYCNPKVIYLRTNPL